MEERYLYVQAVEKLNRMDLKMSFFDFVLIILEVFEKTECFIIGHAYDENGTCLNCNYVKKD